MREGRRGRTAPLVAAAVAATAVTGSAGVRVDTPWFRSLDTPRWYPPSSAFPVVWTALYAGIGWSATRALDRAPARERGGLARTLGTNLVLNAAWTWVFFRGRRPGLALLEALALDASTVSLIRAAGRHDRAAGAALVPYLAWNLFATALCASIRARTGR